MATQEERIIASRDLVVHIIGEDASLQRAYRRSTESTQKFERNMSRTVRGVAAGSGVFKSLGRSLAFASGGFIAAAGVTDVLRGSITQATEAAKVQAQLAAQFKASGQNLGRYQRQIDETSNKLSILAGIENDEVKAAFVTAFRGTDNVSTALKIQAIAADVARARNISLATATLALTKAFAGQSTALRRLGVIVPATLHGMSALNFVQQKFAGQAAAGTTAQDRFAAAFKNMEEVLGTALLPTFNELLDSMTKWLAQPKNQQKVQDETKKTVGFFGQLLHVTKQVGGGFKDIYDGADAFGKKSRALNDILEKNLNGFVSLGNAAKKTAEDIRLAAVAAGAFGPITGEDVAQRGAAARTGGGAAGGAPLRPRASLAFQMSTLQMRFAQAQLTATTRDDRATLVLMQNLLHRQMAATKDYKLRTQLYQDLGSVQNQISAIDDKIAADKQDAADKEKAAKEKERDAEKKRLEAHRDHIRKMREAWAATLAKIREATASVQAEFGQLPFQPTPAGILGVQGQSTKSFVGAYVNQTRQFVGFYNDLNRLSKRGAPGGLVEQIRGQGVGADSLVRGLLTHPRQLRTLIRAFGERKEAAMQIAHADIHARMVHIHMGGARPGATTASSRRNRNAGIPLTRDYLIGGG